MRTLLIIHMHCTRWFIKCNQDTIKPEGAACPKNYPCLILCTLHRFLGHNFLHLHWNLVVFVCMHAKHILSRESGGATTRMSYFMIVVYVLICWFVCNLYTRLLWLIDSVNERRLYRLAAVLLHDNDVCSEEIIAFVPVVVDISKKLNRAIRNCLLCVFTNTTTRNIMFLKSIL